MIAVLVLAGYFLGGLATMAIYRILEERAGRGADGSDSALAGLFWPLIALGVGGYHLFRVPAAYLYYDLPRRLAQPKKMALPPIVQPELGPHRTPPRCPTCRHTYEEKTR